MKAWIASCLLTLPLAGQAPEGWNVSRPLGAEAAEGTSWAGAGVWWAGKHGTLGNFVATNGIGNSLTGGGVHLEGGWKPGRWDLAVQVLGYRDASGESHFSVYRGHLWHRGETGWQYGLEQEPLVWGYGLNGGYLLGEAARPFPRLRFETPMRPIRVFGVPLGVWGFQSFLGRLEKNRPLGEAVQDPVRRAKQIQAYGDPKAPFFSGYRLQALFGENVEFYMNYTNLWGGTLNGHRLTDGYSFSEYATAMFGLKDAFAERNGVENAPPDSLNDARSASNCDVGVRVRSACLARLLEADKAWIYLSRGSKGVYWTPGKFYHHPFRSLWNDLEKDMRYLFGGHMTMLYKKQHRETTPNLVTPNESIGLAFSWPRIRLGIEYSDTTNSTKTGHRSFAHGVYLSGFYTYGDPIGNAMGGEAITSTLRLEADWTDRLSTITWLHRGQRPFRDGIEDWSEVHPGVQPVTNHFLGMQHTVAIKLQAGTTLSLGGSLMRQGAQDHVPGNRRHSYRGFADLSVRWP